MATAAPARAVNAIKRTLEEEDERAAMVGKLQIGTLEGADGVTEGAKVSAPVR
eukprot:CAMPEP_0119324530 /NCGR_PEP_ID=MMETSP1333-20130426/63498_1 /TAXON_ID=418940 /ORGANISM="Scyphosphaera apsteinii, Strain RCC1455" /LENGTH=52 /DNA_ID=CAMNT_0007332255 /DNA_START=395 /DNA_END=553 /DNA_ORIENTATION=+